MDTTSRLTTVFAMVSDMAEACRFVEAATGLKPATRSPFWSEFDTGAAHLALHHSEGPAPGADDGHAPGSVHVSISVAGLEAAVARLRAAGWQATDPEVLEGMRTPSSRVHGPDNLHLHLVQA